jgi:ribosomal protein S18 acetylase RimI-like enzyme
MRVGEKMFSFVKDVAKRQGCGRIEWAVLKWNTPAQDFYEKNNSKRLESFN